MTTCGCSIADGARQSHGTVARCVVGQDDLLRQPCLREVALQLGAQEARAVVHAQPHRNRAKNTLCAFVSAKTGDQSLAQSETTRLTTLRAGARLSRTAQRVLLDEKLGLK